MPTGSQSCRSPAALLRDAWAQWLRPAVAIRRARYEDLRAARRAAAPKALAGYGYRIFSQSDEDGIIAEIFRRIGVTNRIFVEFGAGSGLENNTAALLYAGWRGLWIEGSARACRTIRRCYGKAIETGQLALVAQRATPANIDGLIRSAVAERAPDLLSVDIDGNDAHVLSAIACIQPRVIVVEYNAKFGPSLRYCMAYDAAHAWDGTDRFGASLKYWEELLRARGYGCVGCNLAGTNAFFVRAELLGECFLAPYTAETHYEPARYEFLCLPSGHPCSPDTFGTRVRDEA